MAKRKKKTGNAGETDEMDVNALLDGEDDDDSDIGEDDDILADDETDDTEDEDNAGEHVSEEDDDGEEDEEEESADDDEEDEDEDDDEDEPSAVLSIGGVDVAIGKAADSDGDNNNMRSLRNQYRAEKRGRVEAQETAQALQERIDRAQRGEVEFLRLDPGPQPDIADYTDSNGNVDKEKFNKDFTDWNTKAQRAQARIGELQREAQAEDALLQERAQVTRRGRERLIGRGFTDFDDAFAEAKAALSQKQRTALAKGAKNPALVAYIIGKQPEIASRLAAITDPVQFGAEARQLELEIKMKKGGKGGGKEVSQATGRKAQASKKPRGTGTGKAEGVGGGASMKRLRTKALNTGNLRDLYAARKRAKQKENESKGR